jgi:hypothetical protein
MSDDAKKPPPPQGVQFSIDDDVAVGLYSNFQLVGSNDTEFVVDFAYVLPNQPRGKVRSRVILAPRHAKSLMRMLAERVADYEARFGEIPLPGAPSFRPDGLPN